MAGWFETIPIAAQRALDCYAAEGLAEMQSEVDSLIASARTGRDSPIRPVQLGHDTRPGGAWTTHMAICDQEWTLVDCGAQLPIARHTHAFFDDMQGPLVERNQCLVIQITLRVFLANNKARPISSIGRATAVDVAQEIRAQQWERWASH